MYPSPLSWKRRGAKNKQLWGLNFWKRVKFFFFFGGGGDVYCQCDGEYIIRVPSIFFCIDVHTHYPCLSVLWHRGRLTPVDSVLQSWS